MIGTTAAAAYVALSRRANRHGECWPTVGTLAADLGSSRATAFRAVGVLESKGFVERVPRAGTASVYHLPDLLTRRNDETGSAGSRRKNETPPRLTSESTPSHQCEGTRLTDATQNKTQEQDSGTRPTKRGRARRAPRVEIPVPLVAAVPGFAELWESWQGTKKGGRGKVALQTKQLDRLAAHYLPRVGPERIRAHLRMLGDNGWQGIAFDRLDVTDSKPTPRTAGANAETTDLYRRIA